MQSRKIIETQSEQFPLSEEIQASCIVGACGTMARLKGKAWVARPSLLLWAGQKRRAEPCWIESGWGKQTDAEDARIGPPSATATCAVAAANESSAAKCVMRVMLRGSRAGNAAASRRLGCMQTDERVDCAAEQGCETDGCSEALEKAYEESRATGGSSPRQAASPICRRLSAVAPS